MRCLVRARLKLRSDGEVYPPCVIVVVKGMCNIETNRTDRRNPAHAQPGAGIEIIRPPAVESITAIDEGRPPPVAGNTTLQLNAAHQHLLPPEQLAILIPRGQGLIIIPAHRAVTAGKEAQ